MADVTLPTITVTEAQANLIADALGVPLANAGPEFTAWLTNALIDLVETNEVDKVRRAHTATMEAAVAAVRAALPARIPRKGNNAGGASKAATVVGAGPA